MERFKLIKLKPRAPFHLGERGVGLEETSEIVHSDTIFGALCWCWTLYTGRSAEEFLQPFLEDKPPWLLSSAFPYVGDVLFVPRPLGDLPLCADEGFRRKALEADFLSLKLLERLCQGAVPQDNLELSLDGRLLLLSAEKPALHNIPEPWAIVQTPRVALDRITSAAEIYYTGRLTFARGCGLYVLVKELDTQSELTRMLPTLFRLLGDEGLGGERSCGYGFFEPEEHEISLELPQESPSQLLLSLYNPQDAHELARLELRRSAYRLTRRRNWVFSPQAKHLQTRAVNYFSEGSVLYVREGKIRGRLVNVLNANEGAPHSVYRNGLGFFVSWREGS
ncbi:MAG: type III-A CRISPR-associated RAMP protein Csm4 [Candidatus Methanomethylicaceae archaeon]